MDRHEARPEPCSSALTSQQRQETEQAHHQLKCKQSHSSQPKPGVDTVEMREWVGSETLEVPDSDEAKSNAWDGEKVKHWVDELCVDSPTAWPGPVDKHPLSKEVN